MAITPDILYKIRPYQRISQWPGIQVVAHKNRLGQNLMLMRKEFPEDYDFFPSTYILPYEMNLFKAQFYQKREDGETKKDTDKDKEKEQQPSAPVTAKQSRLRNGNEEDKDLGRNEHKKLMMKK